MASKSKPVVEVKIDATVKTPKAGVGSFCVDKILNTNWTNMEILDAVKSTFPTAKTSYACVAWYRSDLRSKGLIGPRVTKKVETAVSHA